MQCPKCKHPLSDESVNCVYCGEPLPDRQPVSDTAQELTIEDMVKHTMEGIKEKRKAAEDAGSGADPLSLEKTAVMLAKMRDLLEQGRFDRDVYERMALDAVKDFLSTMEDSDQLIFVAYEIADSKFAPFLSVAMIEKIKMSVMDTIAQR